MFVKSDKAIYRDAVYHKAHAATFSGGRSLPEYTRVSITQIGTDSVTLGVELGRNFEEVSFSECYPDVDKAVDMILAAMRKLGSSDEFKASYDKTNAAVRADMARYYAGGGKNWSGD